jgi:hypothetical protein
MMVQAVLGGELRDKQSWVSSNNGGNATVESYPKREALLDDAKWLAALPTSCEDKLRYYVHAEIRPGIRLKEQSDADKMWIRDLFLKHKAPHEKYVVHGHTPVRKPDVQSNRINIDTALVFRGRLTAAVFEDSQAEAIDLLQVKARSSARTLFAKERQSWARLRNASCVEDKGGRRSMRLTGEVVRPRLIEPSAKRRARRRETLIVQMTANAPSGRGR